MTFGELAGALGAQLRRRDYWGVFLFSSLVYAPWVLTRPGWSSYDKTSAILLALTYFFATMWIAPIPWQWSGRSQDAPSIWRGGAQAFFCATAIMSLMTFVDDLVDSWPGPLHRGLQNYLGQICFQGVLLFLMGYVLALRERSEAEKQAISHTAREARARTLQGQLHPHVLFNALNALAELYEEDPRSAETHLRSMSGLLRQVLQASDRNTLPLGEERLLVERYLHMESTRLGDRLRVRWDWDQGLDHLAVLPLLVQPLVENALKHGISPAKRGGDLVLGARREGEVLVLQVRNNGQPLGSRIRPEASAGVGTKNLRERLTLAYGPQASLELRTEAEWTVAEVRLNPSSLTSSFREAQPGSAPAPPSPAQEEA